MNLGPSDSQTAGLHDPVVMPPFRRKPPVPVLEETERVYSG